MMYAQVYLAQGCELAQTRHAELLADALQQQVVSRALKPHRTQVAAYVRFIRMYHVRRLLYRFAPRFAERVAL